MTTSPTAAPAAPVRVALVTGASRGIGAVIAQELAAQGLIVVGTATTPEGAGRVAEALAGRQGEGVCLNVDDAVAVDTTIEGILARHGRLDVLVNNAGITRDGLAMRMKDEDWEAVLGTNLHAAFRLCRAVARPMMKQRHGRIVNITSVIGALGNAGQANYAAAKAGLAGLTRALARELGSRGITVNCVAPGFIETDMTAELGKEQQDALLRQIPLGRFDKPIDVARVVAFLAADAAAYDHADTRWVFRRHVKTSVRHCLLCGDQRILYARIETACLFAIHVLTRIEVAYFAAERDAQV